MCTKEQGEKNVRCGAVNGWKGEEKERKKERIFIYLPYTISLNVTWKQVTFVYAHCVVSVNTTCVILGC